MAPKAPLETQNLQILSKSRRICAVSGTARKFPTGDNYTACPPRTFFRRVHVPLVPRRSDATAVEFGQHKIRVLGFIPAGMKINMSAQAIKLDPEATEKLEVLLAGRYLLEETSLPMEQVVSTILFLPSGIVELPAG